MKTQFYSIIFCITLFAVCSEETEPEKRVFETSFESVDDFTNFYITPQVYKETSFHTLSDSIVHSGTYAHMAWVDGVNEPSAPGINNNHRAYPTIQFQKTEKGVFQTPCYITLWVWLDMTLQKDTVGAEDDWFSFATFSSDTSNNWARTVLVNLNYDGFVHLGHVPEQGEQTHIFQTTDIVFPQRQWVELKIYLDFGDNAYAKVWQDGTLVSHAHVKSVDNRLAQAHFGLYCPPQITSGIVFNDDLSIREVDGE